MIERDELERLSRLPLDGADTASLPDITGVELAGDTVRQRLESLVRQVGNPYLFRVGKTAVKLSFSGDATLEERLRQYFTALRSGQ